MRSGNYIYDVGTFNDIFFKIKHINFPLKFLVGSCNSNEKAQFVRGNSQ